MRGDAGPASIYVQTMLAQVKDEVWIWLHPNLEYNAANVLQLPHGA